MGIWKNSWQSKRPGTPKQDKHWVLRDSDLLPIYSAVSDVLFGMGTTIQNLLLTGQIMWGDRIQMVENRLQWTLINKESLKDSPDFCQEALMMMEKGVFSDQKKKILEFGKAEMFGICKAQYSERRKLQRRSCRNLH